MKAKILQLIKKPFVRNVATVATGTAAAQAIGIAFSPIITRLYGPEAFGLLGTFSALVMVITPISALCYPIAVVLPKRDEDAKALAKLSAYISLGIALIVTLVLVIAGDWLLKLVGSEAISAFKFLIPVNILFAAWLQISQQWTIRKKLFKVKAKADILQAAFVNAIKSGIGLFHPLASVLIIFSTIGHAFHTAMLYLGIKKDSSITQPSNPVQSKTPIVNIAKNHRDFPLYRAPQVFINAISQSLPVLMLASFFGPASAGFYTLGRKVLGLPSRLIGGAVGDVFYPRITEAAHKGENLTKLIIKTTLSLAAIGILPFAIIIIFGPQLFKVVFGDEWMVAGEYARWLSLWLFFMFLNHPSVKALPVLSAQRFHLVFSFFTITIRLLALVIGYYLFNNDLVAIALFGISGGLINIVLIVIVTNKSNSFDLKKNQMYK